METQEDNKVGTVSFWTDGPSFTGLLHNFLKEGSFTRVESILLDGGATPEQIKDFFTFKLQFEGDTREGNGLKIIPYKAEEPLSELFLTAVSTTLRQHKYQFSILELPESVKYDENIGTLTKYFTVQEIYDFIGYLPILKREGYEPKKVPGGKYSENGVVLRDGTFITCGYMDHINLYPILYKLGLAESSCWTDDNSVIHVTSGQANGGVVHSLPYNYHDKEVVTEQQLDTLFNFREDIREVYGEHYPIVESLRKYINRVTDHGGKFNNLTFLQRFYPEIKLPKFSKERFETENRKIFIRTSPKKSLPGLLNSRLVENTDEGVADGIKLIEEEFPKYLGLLSEQYLGGVTKDDNELHYFFQEFLEGVNGVCHYHEKGHFTHSESEIQGEIVKGGTRTTSLDGKHYNQLRRISSSLFTELGKPVQLEFVIHNDEVYIVQLRILENHWVNSLVPELPEKLIKNGFTFSKGDIRVDVKDILIVDSEASSEELIGKKALIVKGNVEFSHILALSKALRIPSIFGTGPIDLSKVERVQFTAINKEAFISEIV